MNKKIYITGGLSSGKSFFAKKLSEKTGIEYFGMDQIVFKESEFEERGEEERNAIFENIVNMESWILEGTFTEDWVVPGLKMSSQIIYLDTPPLKRFYRFIKRTWPEGIFKQSDLFGRVTLVLGFRYKEWDRTVSGYRKLLEPFKDKLVTLISNKEVEDFISAHEEATYYTKKY